VHKHIAVPTCHRSHLPTKQHCPHIATTDHWFRSRFKGASSANSQLQLPFSRLSSTREKCSPERTALEMSYTWVYPEAGESWNNVTLTKAAVDKQLAHRSTTRELNALPLHFILRWSNNGGQLWLVGDFEFAVWDPNDMKGLHQQLEPAWRMRLGYIVSLDYQIVYINNANTNIIE
jgi:hypothetical protein